jgi:Tol biopolymer transport system component
MKRGSVAFAIAFSLFSALIALAQLSDSPVFKGPYLGQKPPGTSPEIFAPGIISVGSGLHSTPIFSPDGQTVLWTRMQGGELLFYMEQKEVWTMPKPAWFLHEGSNGDVPFFSYDGTKLYFISTMSLKNKDENGEENIWYIEKKNGRWSEPALLPMESSDEQLHWQFSFSREGTLYFTATVDDGRGGYGRYDIYRSEFKNGLYTKPELLAAPFNTSESDAMPYIAPDESYLIFSSAREGGLGKSDLYVSFRMGKGNWTEAVNLGPEINTVSHDICPIVTHDGKYLFFLSRRNGISGAYWVDARIIQELKPDRLK